MRQAARVYLETQVTTTSRGEILIMLYDGAIKFLNQAKEKIAARDYAGKGNLISSAIDVINELASSLNVEKGGDLAENLSQLYFYCNKRLFIANSRMDISAVDEVIRILGGIRSAYAQIIDTPEAVAAMASNPSLPSNKGPRAPMGMAAVPVPGPPVSTARARNAYTTQSAAVPGVQPRKTSPDEEAAPFATGSFPAPDASAREPVSTGSVTGEPAKAEPVTKPAVPVEAGQPDLDFDAPAASLPLSRGRPMTASSLYRKFTS